MLGKIQEEKEPLRTDWIHYPLKQFGCTFPSSSEINSLMRRQLIINGSEMDVDEFITDSDVRKGVSVIQMTSQYFRELCIEFSVPLPPTQSCLAES
ncbi:hypothetical protein X798_02112 [Onchocerca flexuosa]|uniref:Uncharacterized protein n=1 Tax=Onchocerca flexuosa TaxID=387005 RepID=A0A238C109_9BILA|nr:hypothetical protein X798_02112 [Onchocerca flexuosa]